MNIRIELKGIKEFQDALKGIAKEKLPFAVVSALNTTVNGIRAVMQAEMKDSFRPDAVPYLKRGILYRKADHTNLSASVYVSDKDPGKGGLSPAHILRPQVYGGERAIKASERRLRNGGFMGHGQYIVPGPGAPRDSYGNISAGQMQRILGFIKAYRESGYSKTKQTQGHYVIPFVGVFRRTGGESIPVLFFTYARPTYEPRFDFYYIFASEVRDNFMKNLLHAWGRIMLKAGYYGR